MFTADVAVEDQDKIGQDSSCMLVHSQGTFCRVADSRIDTTVPAVGLSRVPQKTTKNCVTYHMMPYARFLLHEPGKKKTRHAYSYLLAQQQNCYLGPFLTRKRNVTIRGI